MSAEILARKDGTCCLCPEPIAAGEDYITRIEPVGWVHATCAQGYQHVISEHEEDE